MMGVWGSTRDLALRLTERRSVNGTLDEASYSTFLKALIAEADYFKQHPEHVWLEPIKKDPLGRSCVVALVRGTGSHTIVLTGHFDTVPTSDYGELESLATSPESLSPRIVDRLRANGEDPRAIGDLSSGLFLPGRGLLDMKSGLAAAIAALEVFSKRAQRAGNLLLVAVPDEENSSVGMRAAAPRLSALAARHNLDLTLAINLDALGDEGDGSKGRVVGLGSIGKTLLSAYVVGRETHACYPFNGLSASLLGAELVRLFECQTDLADGEAPPPSTLGMRDLKTGYDVTTPNRVWCFWNIISHKRTASQFLVLAKSLAEPALQKLLEQLNAQARLATRGVSARRVAIDKIEVMTFDEMIAHAVSQRADFRALVCAEAERIADMHELDMPTRALKITEFAWRESGISGPAVVFGFASMPYPPTQTLAECDPVLLARVSDAVDTVSKRFDVNITLADRLDVIADTSFLGPIDAHDLSLIAANTPTWGTSIQWDLTNAPTPGLPTINAGPWGRGYHRWLERVEVRYAFEVLPELVLAIVDSVFKDMGGTGG